MGIWYLRANYNSLRGRKEWSKDGGIRPKFSLYEVRPKLMNHRSRFEDATTPTTGERFAVNSLHPAWRALVRYCADLRHGEIERLKIQDGLPVLAEVTRKKIRFHTEPP